MKQTVFPECNLNVKKDLIAQGRAPKELQIIIAFGSSINPREGGILTDIIPFYSC